MPGYFQSVVSVLKNFEVRKNDRNYQIGDRLELIEITYEDEETGNRHLTDPITYILHGSDQDWLGIKPGFVVLGFELNEHCRTIRALLIPEENRLPSEQALVDKAKAKTLEGGKVT